jgi:hypothetical protein
MASQLTEVFWVTFLTIVSGMVIKIASMCYKSKCKEVSFCCIKIIRDTAGEMEEEENRINHQMAPLANTTSPISPISPSSSPISDSNRNLRDD